VHAPSNLIATSLAVAIPPEVLATFDSVGAYLPRVVPPNTRMFVLPIKRLSQ
jgi:hypothetical protein